LPKVENRFGSDLDTITSSMQSSEWREQYD